MSMRRRTPSSRTLAAASGALFLSASSSVNAAGALVVAWGEAGLGNENITYTLTADATAVYACIYACDNHARAATKETRQGQVAAAGSLQARNGRVQASLVTGPLSAGGFTCPSGQTLVLASVSYTDIILTDATNDIAIAVANLSRTFVNLP